MLARRGVPAFNERKAGNAGFSPGLDLSSVEPLAFEGGEDALAHSSVVAIAERAYRRVHAPFPLQRRPKATEV